MGHKKLAYFQNGVLILGEFFFRTGCQFGVLGGTYPPKKSKNTQVPPLPPSLGEFQPNHPSIKQKSTSGWSPGQPRSQSFVPTGYKHSAEQRASARGRQAKALAVCRPLQKKKGKDLKCTVKNFVFMCPFTFASGFRKHSASEKGHQWSDSYSYSCRITEQNTGKHLACYKLKVRRFFSHNLNKFSR